VDDALAEVVAEVGRVLSAAAVAVVRGGEDGYAVAAVEGLEAGAVDDVLAAVDHDVARAERDVELVVVPRGENGSVLLVPLRSHLAASGVLLVVLSAGLGPLEVEETELLASFADQASLALDRAQALSDREELMLVADRERIARDLHDLVIQRLFATGLQLQGARRLVADGDVRDRLDAAVADLDVTIRDIRSTIFELQRSHDESLRADVRGVVREYVPVLGFTPLVRSTGPVDTTATPVVGAQLLAVLREALSNVARHAEADAAVIEVEATSHLLALRVTDNGRGVPADRRESGLRNVRRRATELGGTVQLLAEEPHGTRLEWTVPLGDGTTG
jgi:signal transduction histidine kinase